ncbi:MAG TPA: HAMP domain-containing sensor histidine kinase [Burkholderiales bacterium]|nr:HAMP domain-containing sensor histidine kinase [Burkholderiales bacterium]
MRPIFSGLRYPRSFLGLLVTGFILVALPLAGALLYSAWNTERLAERSTNAVFNAAQAARASRSLVNRIGTIERLAQQVAVLADPGLRADYTRVHDDFKRVAGDLSRLPLDSRQTSALERTLAQEQSLYDLLSATPHAKLDVREIRAKVDALNENAYEVLAISYLVADREVERLRARAEIVQRRLILLVMFASAVAVAMALALTRIIAGPIAQLEAAIRQLGGADFSRRIRVRGPEDLQHLGERLDWLRRRLNELEAQKNRFLRHLSHELKTPLTALREGTELLNDRVAGPLVPSQQRVVEIMRDNGIKLQRMIEELLDYQRALHAAASLDVEAVPLGPLVNEVVEAHRLAAQAKGQRVALDVASLSVQADAEKLRSILDNLLSNAVKFTPPGGTISVLAREQDSDVLIEVIDTGPGVPAEERESIFDSFFRGRAKASGRIEGTGLGLAIVREFAEAHGGRVAAVAGGRGGHFRVTLPRRQARVMVGAA